MLVEKLKEVATNLTWKFNYGLGHWQNIEDYPKDEEKPFVDRNKYFLLLWKDRDFILNDHSGVQGYNFEGEAVFVVRSKISDEDYNWKYDTHIKSLEQEVEKMFNELSFCDGWEIKSWKESEVENQYDTNMDGLKIRFKLTYE